MTHKITERFESWLEKVLPDIDHVQGLLSVKLSDNPSECVEQLTEIESWQGRITTLLADSNAYLDLAEQKTLLDRHDHWTDLDRKANQRAAVVIERRSRDILAGLAEAIRNRLILGMSIRKGVVGERTQWNP